MNRTKNYYTMIEILVVLMIIGILLVLGIGALNSLSGSGGLSGTVRALSSQLSLGRSQAVTKNQFVAVLLPDTTVPSDGILNDKTNGFTSPEDSVRLFSQSRLCKVTVDEDGKFWFDNWVEDSGWVKWSKGIIVCASENFSQVLNVDRVIGKNSTAIIFANSGTLTHGNIAKIQVFRAKYDRAKGKLIYSTKERKDSGWAVTINPFTGRTAYDKD
jgi:prepilin-type N-terminal cleavage/methylation domain-containing protein